MSEDLSKKFSIILFSGDFDKSLAALTLANGAAGQGMEVSIFFTFWGLNLIRRRRIYGDYWLANLFKRLMPLGPDKVGLSRLNFCGCGSRLLKKLIRHQDGQTTRDLLQLAMERKVSFVACEASLKLLNLKREELIDYPRLEVGGVDAFLRTALESKLVFFI